MVDLTDNHEFQLWADSEEQWEHRSDFETLEQKVWVRDEDAALNDYEPHDGALFLATDTEDVYLGDGNSWTLKWNLGDIGSGGGDGDHASVDGIDYRRQHVGPLHQGAYHEGGADADHSSGIVFEAEDLHIESAVLDSDLSAINATEEIIELREYNGGAADPPIVDSATVPLSGGPERVQLGFDVPASGNGDANDEYVLARAPTTDGRTPVPLRRVSEEDGGQTLFDTYASTDPPIDFLRGTATMASGDFGATAYYYYFFDILVGTQADRTDAPWSTDVDEIYMRPRDPVEEFGDVSPRALWIDTGSQ